MSDMQRDEVRNTCCEDYSEIIREIQMVMFALQETALYLDSHPNDLRVLERHNYFSTRLEELTDEYSLNFNAPLTNLEAAEGYWTYIETPWPWQEMCCYKEARK